MSLFRHMCLAVGVTALLSAPASAQITWNITYGDGNIQTGGVGFADPTVDSGQTLSRGQLRRNSVTAATNYLNTVLDGRGTVNAEFAASQLGGNGPLASYGPNQLTGVDGTFQNGGVYQAARTNTRIFGSDPDGSGQFDFGYGWNYFGQVGGPVGGRFDMVTVAIHELGHGLGFLSFANPDGVPNGQGLSRNTVGTPDIYSGMDRFLQRGNGALNGTSRLFNSTINDSNFASFVGNVGTFTTPGSTNPTTGLFFGGAFARELNGGNPITMYAPTGYQPGSSVSHVDDSSAVMNPSVAPNVVKRFRPYEIAMLMDIGWNVYNWNNTTGSTGNWGDGINGNVDTSTSYTLANSRWRSDSGLVSVAGQSYNRFSAQNPAPVLPIYGQVTANNVLNFSNTGTTAYTSTNNFGNAVRLSRLNFASTNSTGGITIAGGTINFGQNSDLSPSVLVPKIIQNGAGAVTISSTLQVNTIADTTVGGVLFTGHNGVTVEGTGSGLVTLSGTIGGTGGITKNSSTFNLALTGSNTYTGATTVNAGTLFVNGNSTAASGAVTVNNGGTLGGSGIIGRAITVNSGGAIEAGSAATPVNTLTVNENLTVNNGGNLRAQLSGAASDQLNMSNGANVLTLANGSILALSATSFSTSTTYMLADLGGTGSNLLVVNGSGVNADTTISTFTFTSPTAGTSTGPVTITASGFNLTTGDQLLLRRSSGGDLVLMFTPVPEPGAILLVCGLVTAGGLTWRKWKTRAKMPSSDVAA